jgi:ribonuclease HII
MARWLIGVDEAGRGPLAGPVAVGVVAAHEGFNARKAFPGLNDSKKLSPQKREELYATLLRLAKAGELRFCVRYSAATTIDRIGIARAVRSAVHRGVRALAPEPHSTKVLLDGLLHAPVEYEQKTIIGGDSIEPLIMLASVAAKVRRDRLMRRLSRAFPNYGFEVHKGYGTAAHYRALRREGLCEAHRKSFCKNLISVVR